MNHTVDELARSASELPPVQRFALVRRILASVELDDETACEVAWDAEIRKRISRYDAGETEVLSVAEVFEEIDRSLDR
jgi:putative addiction module component (TIGR02574 family)